MPISFEPAQPTPTGVSAGYGYSSTMAGYLPLALQQQQMAQQRQAQAAQLATQQWSAQAALAQHGEQSRQDREQQNQLATLNRSVSDRDVFETQAAMQQNAQRAELAVWANNQEMTQADVMKLQRQKMAVSDIMGRSDWSPEEKADAVTYLRTGIDAGEKRLQATQQKQLQQKMAQEQAQLEHVKGMEQRAAKIDKMGISDRIHVEVEPNVQGAIERELGPLQPTGSIVGDTQALADRAAKVRQLAGERGGLVTRVLNSKGDWVAEDTGKHADAQAKMTQAHYENQLKAHQGEVARYDAALKEELHALDKIEKPEDRLSPEEKDRQAHERLAIRFPNYPRDDKGHVIPPPPPAPPGFGTPGAAPAPPAPRPAQPPGPKPDAVTTADDALADFNRRPVPPEVRASVNNAVEQSKAILARYAQAGKTPMQVYESLPPREKVAFDHYRELARRAFAAAPPAPAAPAPAAPQAQPSVGQRIANFLGRPNPGRRMPGEY